MVLSGAPPAGIPGGEVPDEGAHVVGESGFTYIPEPASLALALGVLMRRRIRNSIHGDLYDSLFFGTSGLRWPQCSPTT